MQIFIAINSSEVTKLYMKDIIDNYGFVNWALQNNSSIVPLIIDSKITGGTGLMNPSIFVDNDTIMVNVRHINYTLYHSENKRYQHQYGPLQYLHPEDDHTLRTNNFIATLDDNLNIVKCNKVETSHADKPPQWHFIGLEDARLFKWHDRYYMCGVRRDHNTTGKGRMDLVEVNITENEINEVSRNSIPAPGANKSYCEKNWMPINDMPFHFVKWTNPTEVVRFDPIEKTTTTVTLDETKKVPLPNDLRGGSQVIKWGNYFLAITHEVNLFNNSAGRKDGRYRHRFVVWDQNWNIIKTSEQFNFMTGEIEFCCGAAFHKDHLLISFGFQDNAAYVLKIPTTLLEQFLDFSPTPKLAKKQIIDFFPYFDATGSELLELRINMLKDHVDQFVIVESNQTHSGIAIERRLEERIKQFNLPQDKITIINLDFPDELIPEEIDRRNCYEGNFKNPNSVLARVRERMQKDALLQVIDQYSDNTVFIVSDSDEIINPEVLPWVAEVVGQNINKLIKIPLVHLEGRADLRVYNTKTNTPKMWDRGMFVCTKQHLKNATPTQMRSNQFNPFEIVYLTNDNKRIEDLGWHFSWMGDFETRNIKSLSFCHYNDTFSGVVGNSYASDAMEQLHSQDPVAGNMSISGEFHTVLKLFDHTLLPKKLFELPRVKEFLLPAKSIFDHEYKKACAEPSDINQHLPVLNQLAQTVETITEFGARSGVSTRAFLNSHATLISYDLVIDIGLQELFKQAKSLGKTVEYVQADVLKITIKPTDLLFIDTWHVYNQLKDELRLHADQVRNYIVLHDTHTFGTTGEDRGLGLLPAVIEFIINNPDWRFKYHSTDNNGLTVLERIY